MDPEILRLERARTGELADALGRVAGERGDHAALNRAQAVADVGADGKFHPPECLLDDTEAHGRREALAQPRVLVREGVVFRRFELGAALVAAPRLESREPKGGQRQRATRLLHPDIEDDARRADPEHAARGFDGPGGDGGDPVEGEICGRDPPALGQGEGGAPGHDVDEDAEHAGIEAAAPASHPVPDHEPRARRRSVDLGPDPEIPEHVPMRRIVDGSPSRGTRGPFAHPTLRVRRGGDAGTGRARGRPCPPGWPSRRRRRCRASS